MIVCLHTSDSICFPRHALSWLLLAGSAGAVNGFAFLECQQFITHVTGTATRLGLAWHTWSLAAEYATVLGAFIAGATVSVVWLQGRVSRGKQPSWASPLIMVALILTAAGLAGHYGAFEPFGSQVATDPPPFVLLSLLAFAMGLQNAAVATTTGLAVRTTHLTGPATDLGIHLGTAWFAQGDQRIAALKAALLRGGKIFAFTAGAALALPLAQTLGYLSLLGPAMLVIVASALSFVPSLAPASFPTSFPSRPSSPEGARRAA
jgi:uncharacterized membrane protein YoaK (UPF0700 family)